MKVSTGSAMQRLKTAGTFIAGGLVGGLIANALQYGWSYAVSNGFDPFGDGGKAAYKETGYRIGTATQAGFAVRPLTASAGQGERFTMAAIPTYLIPAAEAAISGGNIAGQGNTFPANVASGLGGSRPATVRQQLTVTATLVANLSGSQQQPVGQASTGKATKAVIAKLLHKPAHTSTAHQVKPDHAGRPNTGNGQKGGQGMGKLAGKPAKATNTASSGTGAASNGNWVGKLMPGTPAPAVYYSYNAKPSPQEKAAPAHSWVGKLMTDGKQKVKVNSGKVGMATHKKSDLHTGAGASGRALTGGSGNEPIWYAGKEPLKKKPGNVTVCLEVNGILEHCTRDEW